VDGQRPDGLTLIPWKDGKLLTWDVTVVSTLAASYVDVTSRSVGTVTEVAASRKSAKYATLEQSHIFQPLPSKMWAPCYFLSVIFAIKSFQSLAMILKADCFSSGLWSQFSASMPFYGMIPFLPTN